MWSGAGEGGEHVCDMGEVCPGGAGVEPSDQRVDAHHGLAGIVDDPGVLQRTARRLVGICCLVHAGNVGHRWHKNRDNKVVEGRAVAGVDREQQLIPVWLVAPIPDEQWGSDLRLTAKLFRSEADAMALLNDVTDEFHLWKATLTITYQVDNYELVL